MKSLEVMVPPPAVAAVVAIALRGVPPVAPLLILFERVSRDVLWDSRWIARA